MEKLRQTYEIDIRYVYFPLHPGISEEGLELQELFGPDKNIAAMTARLKGLMDQEGLPFDGGRYKTFNSRLAQELAKWGEGFEQSEALNTALYQAYFVDGLNIGKRNVLLKVVQNVGLSPVEAKEVLDQRSMSNLVDADWQRARSIGVTSVPTFAVGLTGVVGAQPYGQLARLVEHGGAERRNGATTEVV